MNAFACEQVHTLERGAKAYIHVFTSVYPQCSYYVYLSVS